MLKKLHKSIGLSICLVVIHLAVTGIILMYPVTFKLHDTYFNNNFLYSLYNMHKTSDVKVLGNGEDYIGVVKSKIVASDMVLETDINDIIGIAKKDNLIYALNNNIIVLIEERDFNLAILKKEKMSLIAKSLGRSDQKVILKDINDKYYSIDNNLNFFMLPENDILYSKSKLISPDEATSNYFLSQVQGPGIQALRLLADLHNGRFFGPLVMVIFSVTSILVIFLAISGSYMTIRPSIKRYYYKKRK
jgi:hypothetical protein